MKDKIRLLLQLFALALVLAACTGRPERSDSAADAREVELVDLPVVNSEGEQIGTVAAVLVEPASGEIGHLVLFFREPRVAGVGVMVNNPRRYLPIPWALFAPGREDGELNLDADETTLILAPYLTRVPESLSTEMVGAVDRFWTPVGKQGRLSPGHLVPGPE